jgi:hypothetical protein
MKKSMMLAAAALATLSFAGDALADGAVVLRTGSLLDLTGRIIDSPGLSPLGFVDGVTALGRTLDPFSRTCSYLMEWGSFYNPNDVNLCVLEEVRTPLNPSCIGNAIIGSPVPTAVFAGNYCHGAYALSMGCAGFDLLGIPVLVDILASNVGGCVAGVVVIDGVFTLSLAI